MFEDILFSVGVLLLLGRNLVTRVLGEGVKGVCWGEVMLLFKGRPWSQGLHQVPGSWVFLSSERLRQRRKEDKVKEDKGRIVMKPATLYKKGLLGGNEVFNKMGLCL